MSTEPGRRPSQFELKLAEFRAEAANAQAVLDGVASAPAEPEDVPPEKLDELQTALLAVLRETQGAGLTLEAAFSLFDTQGSGAVSAEQFRKGLGDIGMELSAAEAAALARRFDTNGNGLVDLEEFVAFATPAEGETEEAFAVGADVELERQGGGWQRASVLLARSGGRYDVRLEDGSREMNVPAARLRRAEPNAVTVPELEARVLDVLRLFCAKGRSVSEAFAVFETDLRGEISPEQFTRGLRSVGLRLTDADGARLAARFDADGNGAVSLPEFVSFAEEALGGAQPVVAPVLAPEPAPAPAPAPTEPPPVAEDHQELRRLRLALKRARADNRMYAHIEEGLKGGNNQPMKLAEANYNLGMKLREQGDQLQAAREALERERMRHEVAATRLAELEQQGPGQGQGPGLAPRAPAAVAPTARTTAAATERDLAAARRRVARLEDRLAAAHEQLEARKLEDLTQEATVAELEAHRLKLNEMGRRLRQERTLRTKLADQSARDVRRLSDQARKLLTSLRLEGDARERADKQTAQWKLRVAELQDRLDTQGQQLRAAQAAKRVAASDASLLRGQLDLVASQRRTDMERHMGSQSQQTARLRSFKSRTRSLQGEVRQARLSATHEREKRVALLSGVRLFLRSVTPTMDGLQFNFSDCCAGDDGVAELMDGLRTMCRALGGLQSAEEVRVALAGLRGEVTPESSQVGGDVAKARPVVVMLDLSHNDLTDVGAMRVAKVLREFDVRRVDLRGNDIASPGAAALLDACVVNPAVLSVDLSGNLVHPPDLAELVRLRGPTGARGSGQTGDADDPGVHRSSMRLAAHNAHAAAVSKVLLHTMSRQEVYSHRRQQGAEAPLRRPESASVRLVGPLASAEKRRVRSARKHARRRPHSATGLEHMLPPGMSTPRRRRSGPKAIRPASAMGPGRGRPASSSSAVGRPASARPASARSRLPASPALLAEEADLGIYEDEDPAGSPTPAAFALRPLTGAYMPSNYQDLFASLPLLPAAKAHEELTTLLEAGCPVNGRERGSGDSLLHRLARHPAAAVPLVRLLLGKGADVDARNNRGETPLHYAVGLGSGDVLALLVEAGADVELADESGFPPLHTAVEKGLREGATALVEAGADLNYGHGRQPTVLHFVAATGQRAMAEFLVSIGADVNSEDANGVCPLAYAENHGHEGVAVVLREAGGKVAAKYVRRGLAMV